MKAATRDSQAGETLLELLIAVVIMGVAVVTIMGGLAASITMSAVHRKQATAGTVLRDYAETLQNWVAAGNYASCATTYPVTFTPGVTPGAVAGFTPTILSATDPVSANRPQYWTGSAWSTTCGSDSGVQQFTVQVTCASDSRVSLRMTVVVRKRCGLADSLC